MASSLLFCPDLLFPIVFHLQKGRVGRGMRLGGMGKKKNPQDIGLAKELVWIFQYNFIEEPELNFWPTQFKESKRLVHFRSCTKY